MTTEWHGTGPSSTDHLTTHGYTFHTNCQSEFPIWFYELWNSYGPTTDILPPAAFKGLNYYLLKAKGLHYVKAVQFYKEFKVPWIFCWSYRISQHYTTADKFPMSLFREYKIKWWDKFNQTLCSDTTVAVFLDTGKKLQHQIQQVTKQQEPTPKPKAPIQPNDDSNSDSDSDNEFQQFLQFQKFKKMQKQFNRSRPHSAASSTSTDPIGGQDPFDM